MYVVFFYLSGTVLTLLYFENVVLQPKFSSLYGSRVNEQNQTVIEVDFGERVVYNKTNDKWASVAELFTITYTPSQRNFSYMDILYDVNNGRLYIIAEVVNFTEPMIATFEIAPGAVKDMVGNPSQGTIFQCFGYEAPFSTPTNTINVFQFNR